MTKKIKGVASTTVLEDMRTKFKYQSLLQDYEELQKETEAKNMKLQMLKRKRSTLLAEVGFLRTRYKVLMENQSRNSVPERNHVPLPNVTGSRKAKKKNYGRYDAALLSPVPGLNLNWEGKFSNLKGVTPLLDLNQKRKTRIGKEVPLQSSMNIPDLNLKDRVDSVKEVNFRTAFPAFDLNRISMEEEELQSNGNTMSNEDSKIITTRAGTSEQYHNDMKLTACRSLGNGSSGSGKRKVSWQDQVALRV